jgi:2'-5' RNA ligase
MLGLASAVRPALESFKTLDVVEIDGIHLTVQGVGFTDEVSKCDIDRIADACATQCGKLGTIEATLEPPEVDEETVHVDVGPRERFIELKRALRAGIADVWGSDEVPEKMDSFRPHITLAYSNGIERIDSIVDTLARYTVPAAVIPVNSVSLIELNRDRKRYEWTKVADVPLSADRLDPR